MTTVIETTEIVAEASYGVKEFQRRTKLGAAALRQAKRNGLKVRKVGRNHFILGRDWLDHLNQRAEIVS